LVDATSLAGAAKADGRVLLINRNQALFSLIGNRFGRDGRAKSALTDLQSAAPNGLT
jgi:microcystin-dependent protein